MDKDKDNAPPVQSTPIDIRPTYKHNYTGHIEDNKDLLEHTQAVSKRIVCMVGDMYVRAVNHDRSKFSDEEYQSFVGQTVKLKDLVYGSDEYRAELEKIRPAIDHHYACNRHHPQHFPNGILGMNLVDIVEMFCDWHAAILRQKNGDIRKSIEIDQERFKFSDDLKQIFLNTVDVLEGT